MSAVDGTVGPWSLLAPIRTRMRAVVALSVLSSVATVASLVGICLLYTSPSPRD